MCAITQKLWHCSHTHTHTHLPFLHFYLPHLKSQPKIIFIQHTTALLLHHLFPSHKPDLKINTTLILATVYTHRNFATTKTFGGKTKNQQFCKPDIHRVLFVQNNGNHNPQDPARNSPKSTLKLCALSAMKLLGTCNHFQAGRYERGKEP